VREEQSVHVKEEPGVQWPPVLLKQVVLRVPVAGQFLLAAVTQLSGPAVDDPLGPISISYDDPLDRRRRVDALDSRVVRKLSEQAGKLVPVERLRPATKVDRAEPGHDATRHSVNDDVQIGEAAHGTSQ